MAKRDDFDLDDLDMEMLDMSEGGDEVKDDEI